MVAVMKILKCLPLAILALTLTAGIASADCVRHFYNKSSFPWFVAMASGTCIIGAYNGPGCFILGGQTAELRYGYSGASFGAIAIRSNVYARVFTVPDGCKLQHDGSTGNVVLNDPADGDVVTCGDGSYACR